MSAFAQYVVSVAFQSIRSSGQIGSGVSSVTAEQHLVFVFKKIAELFAAR